MPSVPHFPPSRAITRGVAYGLAAVVAATVTAGCSGFDKAFGQREAIVIFQQGTSAADRLAVRAACSHIPRATPEPLPTDKKLSDYVNNVRYRIDHASDADLTQLANCLGRFRVVKGIETPQDENS